ncbi:Fibronectin type III domain protein [Allomuricauda ruestringensis DSM 13258]|uniref:Fibronectin type III domain protein n=1 Tax=Allomuricauda ruestringensis (strain DSM 13258 / CIP 107369 / LMG 19739 / B1) TaxID=886377 RepID=G2PN30_ALLRU|nr:fibronectin type III domain-containing protein [Allomuricauda ruestringensis]AEM72378.1 Fibronectin type III domain protein [Allomuricauda ruestringensis DSM 13258]
MKTINFITALSFGKEIIIMVLMLFVACSSSESNSDDTSAETDIQAPSSPTGLTADNITQTSVELNWGAASDNVGIQNYSLYQNGSYLASSGQTSYVLSDLEPGKVYEYQVRATDAAGNESTLSEVLKVTTVSAIEAELQYASGNIDAYLRNLINNVPGSGENNYIIPTNDDLELWNQVIDDLLSNNISDAVSKAVDFNYQITEFTDTNLSPNQVFYVLAEYSSQSNYWGIYVFSKTPQKEDLVLMAPHIKYDTNTGFEAVYSFRNNVAKALLLSGTHRCNSTDRSECSGTTSSCGSNGAYRISDMAHNTNSAFQKTTEVLATTLPNTIFVQLHGFGKDDGDPDVIMSNGTTETPDTDYASLIKDALLDEDNTLTFKIAHIDTDWTRLRGFTNTQGRFINSSPDPCSTSASSTTGRFIHIEQAKPKLRKNASSWAKMSNALGSVF